MRGVFLNDLRIGSVCRFAGNVPAERFVAYSIHRLPGHQSGESRRFPRLRAAMAWLQERHEATCGVPA